MVDKFGWKGRHARKQATSAVDGGDDDDQEE